MYSEDKNIPSRGRRTKADNIGTIRVQRSRWPNIILTAYPPDGFDLFLCIDLSTKTYHATAETYNGPSCDIISTSVEVPEGILDGIVCLARRKDFMSLKNADIFPGQVMLNGYSVGIKVRSDYGSISLSGNMLELTLLDGVIPTSGRTYRTPFHGLAAIGFEAFGIDPHVDLTYESVFTLQEEMRPGSTKVYPVFSNDKIRDLLVLDASRAWFLELPAEERSLDNYSVCVSAYNKFFKALFDVETYGDLVMSFFEKYDRADAMDVFLEKIKGRKAFKVNDFRLSDSPSELNKFIHRLAWKRGNVSQELFMYWYHGVARYLLAAGLPEANVIVFLKEHPLQVGYLYAHGNGLTPENLAKRLLEKPTAPKVYDVYALPKVRVTKKMIAEFRKQLEQEYRKFLPNAVFGEEFIQKRCYGVDDDYIRNALERHLSAEDVVYWETL